MTFLASLLAQIIVPLIEKLLGRLVDWGRDKAAQIHDENETAESLKKTQEAQTEQERIDAARAAARNAGE